MSDEEYLFPMLLKMGFTKVATPITKFQKFLNKFYRTPKFVENVHDYWVEKVINGVKYEVYVIDIWYVQLRIGGYDGEIIFDARRFENEELLSLIPKDSSQKLTKSEKFAKWLDSVIDVTPIIVNYPKLEGTGITFYEFKFKENVIMLNLGITPDILKCFPVQDQEKYKNDIGGETAFTYRTVDGVGETATFDSKFVKLVEDNGHKMTSNIFKYVKHWTQSRIDLFTLK